MGIRFSVNGQPVQAEVDADKPLLWVLREDLGLVGTKFGCGIAACGACTVLLDGQAVRSCTTPIASAAGKAVTTIEGLARDGQPTPVQQAWIEAQVAQCGYCQPGFIMAATALLEQTPDPQPAQIEAALTNLCRCGTYPAMREAIARAIEFKTQGR